MILGLAATLAGCAPGLTPSASTTTAAPSWPHYFKISYDVAGQGDRRTLTGYVVNTYGSAMTQVRLLVQALDANDGLIAQHLVTIPGTIGGFGRSYFEARNVPAADKYRVTVWTFDRIEGHRRWPF